MSKLIGNSSLDIANAPQKVVKEKPKMKLKNDAFVVKSYRISRTAVVALQNMTHRISKETRIQISLGKVLELAIFNAEKMKLQDLIG